MKDLIVNLSNLLNIEKDKSCIFFEKWQQWGKQLEDSCLPLQYRNAKRNTANDRNLNVLMPNSAQIRTQLSSVFSNQ